jgi:hypothetical protein
MIATVLAVLIAGPGLDEPHLSLHTSGDRADEAFVARARDLWRDRFGYALPDSLNVDEVIERLVSEGYTVAIGERPVEL